MPITLRVGPDQAVTTSPACRQGGAKSDRHNNTPPPHRWGHFRPPSWGQFRLSRPRTPTTVLEPLPAHSARLGDAKRLPIDHRTLLLRQRASRPSWRSKRPGELVAHPHRHAADDPRVEHHVQVHLVSVSLRQSRREPSPVSGGKGGRHMHLRDEPSATPRCQPGVRNLSTTPLCRTPSSSDSPTILLASCTDRVPISARSDENACCRSASI